MLLNLNPNPRHTILPQRQSNRLLNPLPQSPPHHNIKHRPTPLLHIIRGPGPHTPQRNRSIQYLLDDRPLILPRNAASGLASAREKFVPNQPGSTSRTWIPRGLTSWYRASEKASSANLEAEYRDREGLASRPVALLIWTTVPEWRRRIEGRISRVRVRGPKKLVAIWARASASLYM